MDRAYAKQVLRLYRPGTTDSLDPEMAEALQLVQRDPELADWFRAHCDVYIAIRDKLKQIEVPPDLKRKILVENVGRPKSKIVPLWNRPVVWAAAAAVAAVVGYWQFTRPGSDTRFVAFRDRQVHQVQRSGTYMMTFNSPSLAEIQTYVQSKHGVDYTLTKGLGSLAGEGCALLHWQGKPVTMVCLNGGTASDGKKKDLYLFVARRADFSGELPGKQPEFKKILNLTAASWTAGDKVYILTGDHAKDEAELKPYLDSM